MQMTVRLEVYSYKDIMAMLGIGKNQAYALMKSGEFPIIRIGKTYKVSKQVFDCWLHQIRPEKQCNNVLELGG